MVSAEGHEATLGKLSGDMSDLFWLSDAQMGPPGPCFPKSHGKPRVHSPDRLKDWRRVATRYDRCPRVFPSAIALAVIVIYWL